ncbi:MAG: 2-succinyl-5-enolpyruvyl-6-hydroxy-3- cyclohexene-carboxylic-acid synthase [Cyanobacteria bacterium RYN_339]|nr:2-succinyl-5-enolpyruvyl-6-hydroxy-3- cyclohexene-carboxylic-acid synthase [Cyanobacteria bacterium RYN_339]
MTFPNLNALWCHALVETLAANGVRRAVISPGSRSTPLALAAFERLEAVVHADERSAAFFALGLATADQAPVVLICTSGTAAANYAPAVIEASLSRVPLVVITADRPPAVRGLGAAQTIDQVHLYGHAVRRFAELPLPAFAPSTLRAMQAQVGLAVAAAGNGPVHLNAPFEEPLAPVVRDAEAVARLAETLGAPPRFKAAVQRADEAALAEAAAMLLAAERPLIVAGSGGSSECGGEALLALAAALGAPLVADVASDLRGPDTIKHADVFLRDPAAPRPDLVLRVGGAPTGQGVIAYLGGLTAPVIAIHADLLGRESDLVATLAIAGDVSAALHQLTALLSRRGRGGWVAQWQAEDARIAQLLPQAPAEARALLAATRARPRLCLSNSLPVRHADTYWAGGHRVHAFRGANGIDGVTSQALGIAHASGDPTLLVTGDLAFLHDLGGLQAARELKTPFVILLLNNDGGGIFSYLPIASATPAFEALFGTPHGLRFAAAAALFGLPHVTCVDPQHAGDAVTAALATPGVSIVEFLTTREQTAAEHQAFMALARAVPV